jgi:hypothetical protein
LIWLEPNAIRALARDALESYVFQVASRSFWPPTVEVRCLLPSRRSNGRPAGTANGGNWLNLASRLQSARVARRDLKRRASAGGQLASPSKSEIRPGKYTSHRSCIAAVLRGQFASSEPRSVIRKSAPRVSINRTS